MRFSFLAPGARVALVAAVASLTCACSSKSDLIGPGGECTVATECQSGLVCIPQKSGSKICSNDLGSIQQLPPAPPDGGTTPTPMTDAASSGDGAGTGPTDTGAPSGDAAGD